jgi:ribosome-associated heat shock protein Hsp15
LNEQIRIDKWLWHARFCKTRGMAQDRAVRGHIRLNGQRVEKSSVPVRIGDMMTLTHLDKVILVKVLALGARRGPASEARLLYEVIEE